MPKKMGIAAKRLVRTASILTLRLCSLLSSHFTTEDAVTVAVADGAVRITGAGLTISLMNQGFVTVCGNVADVALLPGGCP